MIVTDEKRLIEKERPVQAIPNPEVTPKAKRRQFSAAYKLRILREVEACEVPGEVGALLRREGLYSSLLTDWRRQRDAGALAGLSPRQRGPKPSVVQRRVAELECEVARLRLRLEQAETIIEVQKKLARMLEEIPKDERSA
jgi:transposase-like protein